MNVWAKNAKAYAKQKQLEIKADNLLMTSQFKSTNAYVYVGKNDRYHFIDLLFKFKPTSVYKKLCYPNQDYIM
jgi:hypothetical protein